MLLRQRNSRLAPGLAIRFPFGAADLAISFAHGCAAQGALFFNVDLRRPLRPAMLAKREPHWACYARKFSFFISMHNNAAPWWLWAIILLIGVVATCITVRKKD